MTPVALVTELVCPRCANESDAPDAGDLAGPVTCSVCGYDWQPPQPRATSDRRRGLPDRRVRARRSNWTAATQR